MPDYLIFLAGFIAFPIAFLAWDAIARRFSGENLFKQNIKRFFRVLTGRTRKKANTE